MLTRMAELIYRSRHAAPLIPVHLGLIVAPFTLVIIGAAPPQMHLLISIIAGIAAILGGLSLHRRAMALIDAVSQSARQNERAIILLAGRAVRLPEDQAPQQVALSAD